MPQGENLPHKSINEMHIAKKSKNRKTWKPMLRISWQTSYEV